MKKWLYFLVDDQGRSYKKNGSVIQQVSQPTSLPNSPDGWQDISIGYERNMNRFGIIRNFSLPLGFVKAANDILRFVYLTGTVETKLFLLIKYLSVELTVSTYKMIYRFFYKGELDLSTIDLGDTKTTVSIMEGGISKDLAANEATTYELDMDVPEAVNVVMDGMVIRSKHVYTNDDGLFQGLAYGMSFILTSKEGIDKDQVLEGDYDVTGTNGFFNVTFPYDFSSRYTGYLLSCLKATTPIIELKFTIDFVTTVNFRLEIKGSDGVTYYNLPNASYTGVNDFVINTSFAVPAGVLLFVFYVVSATTTGQTISNISLKIDFDFRFDTTIVKALLPTYVYQKMVGKITGNETNAVSDLLELNKGLVLLPGDSIRGIAGSKLKTSLKDFFDSYNCWLNAGMGIENKKLRFELKSRYFNDSATPFHLGKAKNLRITPASDLMCSLIKTGYKVNDVNEAWGKYEYNNTSDFTTPIKKIVKPFDLVAPYRTDPSGIETIRVNLDGKTTTDSNSDNDVFALNIDYANPNIDGSYNLLRPAYTTLDGIPTESQSTVFNIDTFTPKRIFKTHGSWLRSIFYGFETSKLKFETTQKNRNLKTVLAGVIVDEDADEVIGNLAAPLFKPYYLEFECQSPKTIVEKMDDEPNEPFSFEWEGETFKGFLIKAGIAPDSNKEQTIKLLCSPSNDITKFI